MGMLAKNSHAELSKNEISQEVLDVFPLYLELIRKTKRRWLIGKLSEQDHPYDVFMAPEEYVVKNGRRVHIQASSFVQTKRIQTHPREALTKEVWQSRIQSTIDKYVARQRPSIAGLLHFYCPMDFAEPLNDRDMADIFRALSVSLPQELDGITISYKVLDTLDNTQTVRTWIIHPQVIPLGTVNVSLSEVRHLYKASG